MGALLGGCQGEGKKRGRANSHCGQIPRLAYSKRVLPHPVKSHLINLRENHMFHKYMAHS